MKKLLRNLLLNPPPSIYNPPRRVVVTGMGVVTPLGSSVDKFWKALNNKECGIRRVNLEEIYKPFGDNHKIDIHSIPSKIFATVPDFDFSKWSHKATQMTRPIQFAMLAASQALEDANWFPKTPEEKEYTGVAIGSGIGGLEEIAAADQLLNNGKYKKISPFSIPRMLINSSAGAVSVEYELKGPNHAVATACATGGHGIGDAYRMIKYGDANVMVCGGTEASIHPTPISGFCRARALSTKYNDTPHLASRPFDINRDGFVMGEGAGILVLEEYEHALKRGAKIYAEIRGYGLGGDGYHITAPNPDGGGSYRVMKKAIEQAGLKPEHVQHVNAHATSTPTGDRIEYLSIKRIFQDHCKNLKVTACKGAIGHLLGASGAVEAVATILAIHHNRIPPTLNFSNLDKDLDDDKYKSMIVTESEETEVHVAINNAFGFGGTNCCLLFTKPPTYYE